MNHHLIYCQKVNCKLHKNLLKLIDFKQHIRYTYRWNTHANTHKGANNVNLQWDFESFKNLFKFFV